jgi:alpha-1,2-mannosyltransferase
MTLAEHHDIAHDADSSPIRRSLMPMWAAVVASIVVVVIESAIYFAIVRHQSGAFSDLVGRAMNFDNLKTTGNIYSNFALEAFTYPPGGILLLCPVVLIPFKYLGAAWTVGVLGALAATFFVVIRRLMNESDSNTLLLATALTIVSPIALSAVYDNIFWGQIGVALTLAIVVDFLVVRGGMQGVLVGLATSLKIYPGIFIIIWLTRRQYRQALTAIATVIVTTLVATALWYHSSISFFKEELIGSQELGHFSTYTTAQTSSSVVDIFLRPPYFLGHLSSGESMVVAAVVAVIGLIASFGAWWRGSELTAVVVGLVISTICCPISWNHYFAFLPLLLFLPLELGWRSWTTRVSYLALVVNIFPWHRWRIAGAVQILLPKSQLYLSYVSQNATTISMLLIVLVAAYEFWPANLSLKFLRHRRAQWSGAQDTVETPSL